MSLPVFSLEGQVAIVTGGKRGIGKAISLAFAEHGAAVVVNYVNSEQLAIETVNLIKAMNGNAFAIRANVSKYEQVEQMVERTLDRFGKIDILVNNAGINKDGTVRRMSEEMWDDVIAVNLKGVFNCTKAVISHMVKRKSGKIINISSVVGQIGTSGASNYAASKAGIIGFTKSVAKEVVQKGITVNALALGYFDTGMLRRLPENIQADILQRIPMARFGRLEEISGVALFLASDAADYMTGQVIHVNGGFYM